MEEIEYPVFLFPYFHSYALCQNIFPLRDIILNSLPLSAHLIPLPTFPSCLLSTISIVDQTSNPFVQNCLKKHHFFHQTSLQYLCACAHCIHVYKSCIHLCIFVCALAYILCMFFLSKITSIFIAQFSDSENILTLTSF